MSEMVERVAKAMEEAGKTWLASRPVYEGWADVPDEVLARAAIEAMHEATDAMIMAGISERHDQPVPEAWKLATVNVYRAMIDAALQ